MERQSLNSLGVYQRSLALRDLSEAVAHYFSRNKDLFSLPKIGSFRDDISQSLMTDAVQITKEVEQAALSNSYSVKMRSLTFINIMTRNILAYCNGLERDGVKEKEYLNLLRGEIKTFRSSFKKWRKSFHPGNGNDPSS
ncbi:TIGR03643 family protein [Flagellimonas myxillae]|uniref:TIGR03643 family protein n=1 Tax=Flagellimonas myxillae TaxID=2942214 RepID=UPI00201EBE51|nr:TIGR03643 family protein [Muricauda myxillae]MCL6265195.1 TIGR03643 family protein [Muricauda myxillae]